MKPGWIIAKIYRSPPPSASSSCTPIPISPKAAVPRRSTRSATRPSAHLSATVELRFQFRYAAPPEPRLLQLDPQTLCFSTAGLAPSKAAAARKKVEPEHVTKALAGLGQQARYNQLREQVMDLADCSRRTAQLAIAEACRQGSIVQADGQYRLPF